MSDDEGFKRKSRRMAAIEASKRIKKNAEDNAQKYPLYPGTLSDVTTSDNNRQRQKGCKRRRADRVLDSRQMVHANNILQCSNPSKSEEMPKKRRGRPPKSKSTKCHSRRSTTAKYKDPKCEEPDYDADVNLRRESYNAFLLNNDPMVATIFLGPKQLHLGNGGISYRESLMRFTKDLGPTAQKVARRMLQGQGLTHQAAHQLGPLIQSPDSLRFMHVNSINDSVKNTITNQVNQPLISFADSSAEAIANYKGKKIMVDEGKLDRDRKKWDVVDNLEFLFGKQKGGVKIGNGPLQNKDFVNCKNLDYSQVGNRRTINQIGSFWSNYNGNLNQNVNKISGIDDISGQKEGTPSTGKPNSCVYPSRNMSCSYSGFDGGVSSFSRLPQPPMHSPRPMQPPRNFWKQEQEFQLASSLNKQMKNQESNVWSQNLWAPAASQANQILQPHPHIPVRPQPQDRLLMPMPPHFWSRSDGNDRD